MAETCVEPVIKEIKVEIRTPHAEQRKFIESKKKRKVVRAGRRGGKTVGAAILAIRAFVAGGRVLYTAPTSEQTDAFWYEVKLALDSLLNDPELKGLFKVNEQERYIERVGTQTRLRAKTAWNADSLRGDFAQLIIFDEFQLTNEDAWEVVGAPMLLDCDGDAVFIYTPPSLRSAGVSKSRDPRHAAKLFKMAQGDTTGRWEAFHFTSHQNPYISQEALKLLLLSGDMSKQSYRQEILAEDDEIQLSWLVYGSFNEQICKIPRFSIDKSWPRYVFHDFGCVDERTEILTKEGWKYQTELKDTDITLTINPKTGQSEWQPILKINRFNTNHEGLADMRLMEQNGYSSFTTHNHRWLVEKRSGKRKFATTETLKRNDKIITSAECCNLPSTPIYSDNFVELVAYFWTEGQITAGGISIWQNEGDYANDIRECLRKEYGEPLTQTRNGRERAEAGWLERPQRVNVSPKTKRVTGGIGCHFAINLNGAKRLLDVAPKRVIKPAFITSLTLSQLKLFIETSIKVEGWQRYGRGHKISGQSISQSKIERLNAIQMACALVGIRTNLAIVSGCKFLLSLYKREHLYLGQVKQARVVYDGMVWCPTTPNGTWFARRNGTTYFTGNTANPAALVVAQNPSTADFIVEYEYLPGAGRAIHDRVTDMQKLVYGTPVLGRIGGNHQEDEIRQAYAAHDWPISEPKINSVKLQVDRVRAMMDLNKIKVFEDCTSLLEEIMSCLFKPDMNGHPTDEIMNEKNYHLLACSRYGFSDFRPETVTRNITNVSLPTWRM